MDSEKLTLFTVLAETKHFHRAAERCHVSPSKLSRVIRAMEEELNTELFIRDKRSVELSANGRLFLAHARGLLQQWDTLKDRLVTDKEGLSGAISLYCSVTASYSFLYEILKNFRSQHPRIEIKLHTGDPAAAIERVVSGQEDLAIAARTEKLPADINFKRFTQSPLVFISPINEVPLHKHLSAHVNDLWSEIPLIISERGIARERIDDWFRQHSITPNIYAQVAGHEAIVSMVSLGFGVGLVPKIVADNSPLKDKVKLFRFQPKLEDYDVGVCVLNKRLKSPLVRAFWELIQDQQ
jgi:LysR family positive regulator for ilvC